MKIQSVSFKNINSLKGEHHIDFASEAFSQNPLFAITGPTGSGKTTILDVICLALFCEVPRIGKISKSDIENKGAILTKNQKEAYAKVCYECSQGCFVSQWSISTARTGNLREYEMDLWQEKPFKALDLKKSEVPGENEQLIGLSYGQFIKSVLLAQGEFAKFLKAGKKERSALLEQITGTGIYRQLGIKAYRKYKDEHEEIEQQVHILKSEKEDLLPAERHRELTQKRTEQDDIIGQKETYFETLKTSLRQRSELEALQKKLKTTGEYLTNAVTKEQEFLKTQGKTIEDHEAVMSFSADLHNSKHQKKQLNTLKKEQDGLVQKAEHHKQKQNETLTEIERFVGHEVNGDTAENHLQEFYGKVNALQEKHRDLKQHCKEQHNLFSREITELDLGYTARDLSKDPAKWHAYLEKSNREWQQVLKEFTELPDDVNRAIETAGHRLKTIEGAQHDQRFIAKMIEDVAKTNDSLTELKERLNPLPKEIKDQEYQAELSEEQLKNLKLRQKNNLMQARLDSFRDDLKPGEPCPLCGSLEHPWENHGPEKEDILDAEVVAKEKEHTAIQNRLIGLKTKETELNKQVEDQAAVYDSQLKELVQLKKHFKTAYGEDFSPEENDWTAKINRQKEHINRLKELDSRQQDREKIKRAQPVFDKLQEILDQWRKIGEEVKTYYTGDNLLKEVTAFQTQWRDLKQATRFTQENLNEVREKIEQASKSLTELKQELVPKLTEKGFDSTQAAEAALLPTAQYQSLKNQRQEMSDRVTGLKSQQETLSQQKTEAENAIQTELGSDELQVKKERVETELKEIKGEREHYSRLLKNHDELLIKTEAREQRIAEHRQNNKRWEILNELIGDATGNKFNQFAQDLTLRHLLKLANLRLKELSERYRLEADQEKDGSLVVADLDMGGQKRSVKTLSGGETFLMSLSLALALSDLASKNIAINSLFIDEGFGTLDPETLDQTLDTLERLQASSSKTIGIISHVDSLKERIGTQIQLTKNGQGYSSLAIVSH